MKHGGVNVESSTRSGILVLGMHRSGTSALTRVLNLLGCDVPANLMGANRSNEAGHWESTPIARLNDEILASAGSEWCDWLAFNPGWKTSPRAEEFKERALNVLKQEYGSSRLFVLKDPRICRFAGFWLDVFRSGSIRPAIVLPLRNPTEVAESLNRRDGVDQGLGYLLWLRHVLDAEVSTRGEFRFHTSYEGLLNCWPRLVANLQGALDIHLPRLSASASEEVDMSLNEQLRHHRIPEKNVLENPLISSWVRGVFGVLGRWAEEGEAQEDFAALDAIREEFNAAAPAFSRVVSAGRRSTQRATELEKKLAELEARLKEAEAAQTAQGEGVTRLEAQLEEKRVALSLIQASEKKSAQQTALMVESLAKVQAETAVLRSAAQDLRRDLEQRDAELSSAQRALALRETEAAEVSAKLDQLRANLLSTEEASRSDIAALEERFQTEVKDAEQRFLDARTELTHLQAEFAALQTEATSLREELDQRNAAFSYTQSALAQRSAEADETATQLAELRRNFEEAERANKADVAAREDRARTAIQELESRYQKEIDRGRAASLSRLDEIIILSKNLRDKDEEISYLHVKNAELAQKVQSSQQSAGQKEREMIALRAEGAEMRRQLAEANEGLRREAERTNQLENAIEIVRGRADAEKAEGQLAMRHLEEQSTWLRELAALLLRPKTWEDKLLSLLPFRTRMVSSDHRLLQGNDLFDFDAYLSENPDVAISGVNPLRHYVVHGLVEGRKLPAREERKPRL